MNSFTLLMSAAYFLAGIVALITLYSVVVLVAVIYIEVKFRLKERK